MFWGGLRGALVMALALSLPINFPEREAILNMTFGVVIFTLLVPGLTMEPLVRLLGMQPKQEKWHSYQECKALLMAYRNELQQLAKLNEEGKLSEQAFENWKEKLQNQIIETGHKMESLQLSDDTIDQLQDREAKILLLEQRKDYLNQLVKEGIMTQESAHHLCLSVDSELDQLGRHEHAPAQSDEQQKAQTERPAVGDGA